MDSDNSGHSQLQRPPQEPSGGRVFIGGLLGGFFGIFAAQTAIISLLATGVQPRGAGLPFATLAIIVIGSFVGGAVGFVKVALAKSTPARTLKFGVASGVCLAVLFEIAFFALAAAFWGHG